MFLTLLYDIILYYIKTSFAGRIEIELFAKVAPKTAENFRRRALAFSDIYIYIYMYVYMSLSLSIYIYIHIHTQYRCIENFRRRRIIAITAVNSYNTYFHIQYLLIATMASYSYDIYLNMYIYIYKLFDL